MREWKLGYMVGWSGEIEVEDCGLTGVVVWMFVCMVWSGWGLEKGANTHLRVLVLRQRMVGREAQRQGWRDKEWCWKLEHAGEGARVSWDR